MRKQPLFMGFLYGVLACMAGACSNETFQTEITDGTEKLIKVTATAGMPQGADTRLDLNEGSDKVTVIWSNDIANNPETFSVLKATDAAPITFTQTGIVGDGHKATFEGSIASSQLSLYALYPALPGATATASADHILLNLSDQDGALDASKIHLYSQGTLDESSNPLFNFKHLTSILKLTLIVPANGTGGTPDIDIVPLSTRGSANSELTDIELRGTGLMSAAYADVTGTDVAYTSISSGSIMLKNGKRPTDYKAELYFHLLPGTMSNVRIVAKQLGVTYTGVVTGSTTIEAGKMYTKTVNLEEMTTFSIVTAAGAGIEPELLDKNNANSQANPYLIAKPENLRYLAKQLTDATNDNPTTDKYYKLTTDMKVTAAQWTPIGTPDHKFEGHFDGDGYVISGTLYGATTSFGFFGESSTGSSISNLKMAAFITLINGSYGLVSIGSVIGYNRGTITGCSNSGMVKTPKATYNWTDNYHSIGGIVGRTEGDISFCTNVGKIEGNVEAVAIASLGGIAGYVQDCSVSGCNNSGTVQNEGIGHTGGIIGHRFTSANCTSEMKLEACTNSGTVIGNTTTPSAAHTYGDTGGIIGSIHSVAMGSSTISLCTNTGNVTGSECIQQAFSNTGGVIGDVNSNAMYFNIHLCHNSGVITPGSIQEGQGGKVHTGGILGMCNSNRYMSIYSCCTNTGTPEALIGNGTVIKGCDKGHTTP